MKFLIDKDVEYRECVSETLRLFFVIRGGITVSVSNNKYYLNEEDVIVVNPGYKYSVLNTDEDTIVFQVDYSEEELSETDNKLPVFSCNSAIDELNKEEFRKIRVVIQDIIYRFSTNMMDPYLEKSLLYQLLGILVKNFISEEFRAHVETEDEQISQICRYVNLHYAEHISLSMFANQLFTSKSSISRHFKNTVGIGFAEYVLDIRIRNAKRELQSTNKEITRIAIESGFTNISTFTRAFRQIVGVSPSVYRKNSKEAILDNKKYSTVDLVEQLSSITSSNDINNSEKHTLNVKALTNLDKICVSLINIGPADSVLSANLQFHIEYLKKEIKFKYGRIWGIFSKKMCITDGQSNGEYNFDQLDIVLDYLLSIGIIPFIDFGFRPNAAIERPGKHVFCEYDVIEFPSVKAWRDTIRALILHLKNRYGESQVKHWIFEYSYPFLILKDEAVGRESEYIQFFCEFYSIIKSLIEDVLVGGPMCNIGLDDGFFERFIASVIEEGCKIDFASFMFFPYEGLLKDGQLIEQRVKDDDFEIRHLKEIKRILKRHNVADCKIIISEWNNTLSNRNYINDSCFRATCFLNIIAKIYNQVDMIGIWTASDWISSYYDTGRIANGGSGLITKNTIPKPIFYGLQFLNQLGEQWVYADNHVIVGECEDKSFLILMFNHGNLPTEFYMDSEIIKYPLELEKISNNNDSIKVTITFTNLRDGKYVVKKQRLNCHAGDVMHLWKDFNYEKELKASDVSYIRNMTMPAMSLDYANTIDGTLLISQEIEGFEAVMLHLYPV